MIKFVVFHKRLGRIIAVDGLEGSTIAVLKKDSDWEIFNNEEYKDTEFVVMAKDIVYQIEIKRFENYSTLYLKDNYNLLESKDMGISMPKFKEAVKKAILKLEDMKAEFSSKEKSLISSQNLVSVVDMMETYLESLNHKLSKESEPLKLLTSGEMTGIEKMLAYIKGKHC